MQAKSPWNLRGEICQRKKIFIENEVPIKLH